LIQQGIGEVTDKKKPRRSKCLNILKICVNKKHFKKAAKIKDLPQTYENLIKDGLININVTKTEAEALLKASETQEEKNARKKIKTTFNYDLKYKLQSNKHFKDWLRQKQREEIKEMTILYFSIKNLDQFLKTRESYINKNGKVQYYYMKPLICQRCHHPFYGESEKWKNHIEQCRGKGVNVGRVIMPCESQKLKEKDAREFDHWKAKEFSPVTILCDCETIIVDPANSRLCSKCHQFAYGCNR